MRKAKGLFFVNKSEQISMRREQKEERRYDSFRRQNGEFDEKSIYNYTLLLN